MSRFACSLTVLAMLGLCPIALHADEAADARATAEKNYADLFGEKEAAALWSRDDADDVALSQLLVATAKDLGEKSPTLRAVMYEKALDLAKGSRDGLETAGAALDELETLVPDEAAKWQSHRVDLLAEAFQRSTRDERLATAGPAYLDALTTQGDRLMESGRATEAVAAYQRAMIVAAQIRDTETRAQLQKSIIAARPAILLERKIKILEGRLERDASDTAAAQELTLIYLLELGNVKQAKKFAEKSGDAVLIQHLTVLAVEPSVWKPDALLVTGDWLRGVASSWPSDIGKRRGFEQAMAIFTNIGEREGLTAPQQIKAKVAATEIEAQLVKFDHVDLPKPVGTVAKKLASGLVRTIFDATGKTPVGRDIVTFGSRHKMRQFEGAAVGEGNLNGNYAGFINVPVTGKYLFRLHLRAEMQVMIDGKDVTEAIRRDSGLELRLQKGPVPFQINFAAADGTNVFLKWLKPGDKELDLIPTDAFAHDANAAKRMKMGVLVKGR